MFFLAPFYRHTHLNPHLSLLPLSCSCSTTTTSFRPSAASTARLHDTFLLHRRSSPVLSAQPRRHLNLQEYQSKELMAEAGVNVQRFKMADTEAEGVAAGEHLMGTVAKELVIKVRKKIHFILKQQRKEDI